MKLAPMRYKGYTWPHNPRVYSIDYERKMAAHKTPFGLFHLQDLGRTNRIMEGEGEFVGEDAYTQFGQLADVFYENGAGLLVHPLWKTANAYFVSLRLEQEPRQDYVRYSFSFWEDDSWYTGLVTKKTGQSGSSESGDSNSTTSDTGERTHRVVQGDTLWAVANTYGLSLTALVALNPQIKNPNLIRVGDEVRVPVKGFVTDATGQRWALPSPTAWQLEYTAGVPCDSFWMRCPWEPANTEKPSQWVGFTAEHEGERVFTGVMDECEVSFSAQGGVLEVSGRGMAARLLDNEALGQDYHTATQADILRDHVTPYGIEAVPGAALTPVSQFSVATGSSEWSVVYEFARYYGGIAPRFDRKGQLVLTGWTDGEVHILDDSAPVTQLVCRDKRYGVLSQILMRDRFSGAIQTVDNSAFLASGGQARRVLTMPGRSNYKAMRYTGQFQLDKAASELERLEVTVAQPFCAWPGDLVSLQRSNWKRNGLFRVVQATVAMNNQGYWSQLELAQPDFVV